jgi:hypothetical protein
LEPNRKFLSSRHNSSSRSVILGVDFIQANISDLVDFRDMLDEENDATPRAGESSPRAVSVGSLLKTELFRGSSESDVTINLPQLVKAYPRDRRDNFNPLDMDLYPSFQLDYAAPNIQVYSEQLQRRQSKGKKLISKAFDKFGNARSKSMHFLRSKSSKDSLLRQVSLRNLGSSRPISSEATSRSSSRFSFEQDSIDIATSSNISVISAEATSVDSPSSFILYPGIAVVPEVGSVDIGHESSIWAAVVVTGVLQRTGGHSRIPHAALAPEIGCMSDDGKPTGKKSA